MKPGPGGILSYPNLDLGLTYRLSDIIPLTKFVDRTVKLDYFLDWRHLNHGLTYAEVTWVNLITRETRKLRLFLVFSHPSVYGVGISF